MRTGVLIRRSIAHYWRTNAAVILGVATSAAVLAGALLVGDSVRGSLRELLENRIGNTEFVLSSPKFFREELANHFNADLHSTQAASDQRFDLATSPLIALPGAMTHQSTGRRAAGQIYGIDERFWTFHGLRAVRLEDRDVLASDDLARELQAKPGDSVLLSLERPSLVPSESLHGRRESSARTMRLTLRNVLPTSLMGEFSTRAEQGPVRAIFVSLSRLQRELELDGRINTILIARQRNTPRQLATGDIRARLRQHVTLTDLGLSVRYLEAPQALVVESESGFLSDQELESATAAAAGLGWRSTPVLTYLANRMRIGKRAVPYSLVTALDLGVLGTTIPVSRDEGIVLNEWAARELAAKSGDRLEIDYFIWGDHGALLTRTAGFTVAGTVPLGGAAADRDLTPRYEGITDTDDLSDWDPPFPVDLSAIRPSDEAYWDRFRTTPKAFLPLEVGQRLWASRHGRATSLRIVPPDAQPTHRHLLVDRLTRSLDPGRRFNVYPARSQGEAAARGATDFGEYFVYFSFFLVFSAVLLTMLFFRLGIEQRRREIGTLRALGFSIPQVRRLFIIEAVMLASIGSLLGAAGAVAYGWLLMYGLRTWWLQAVGTTSLRLHVSMLSLVFGVLGAMVAAIVCIIWTMRGMAVVSPRALFSGGSESGQAAGRATHPRYAALVMWVSAASGVLLLLSTWLRWLPAAAGFFGAGTAVLLALWSAELAWLRRSDVHPVRGMGWWAVSRLGFRYASSRPSRSVLCIALIASASFIIVSLDGFRRGEADVRHDRRGGTGAFALVGESVVPLYHDPNSSEGREALTLTPDIKGLEEIKFSRFRLRPGEDASCLNLYRPQDPRILGVTSAFIRENRFSFDSSMAVSDGERANPWLLLEKHDDPSVIPVIADMNSLRYVLHLEIGDFFELPRTLSSKPIRLRVVAALADSLFQSEFLMSERHFLRLFPELEGYRFFLIDVPTDRITEVEGILEDRLSDLGLDLQSTAERLATYHRVENTYLSTFQALGGLGLGLGTIGLGTVLLRNILERRRELALLRAIGYRAGDVYLMNMAENSLLLITGLATGACGALIAIAPVVWSRGGRFPILAVGGLLLLVLVTGLAASLVATAAASRTPLLPALRTE